jgi:hypothetical protein
MSWKTFEFWLESAEFSGERRKEVKPSMVRSELCGVSGTCEADVSGRLSVELRAEAYFANMLLNSAWLSVDLTGVRMTNERKKN